MTYPDDLVTEAFVQSPDGHVSTLGSWGVSALTKRELFAAMAMQGLCADNVDEFKYPPVDTAAKCAVNMADALIKALNA